MRVTSLRWSAGGGVMLAAAAVQLACLALVVRRRHSVGATGLAGVLVALAVWDLLHALELLAATDAGRALWGALKYVGIVALPPAWLTFVAQYTDRAPGLSRRSLAALLVVPGIALGVLAAPSARHLLRLYRYSGQLEASSGPLFWPFVAYTGLVLIGGLVVFAARLMRVSRVYLRQSVVLIAVALLPTVSIFAFNTRFAPWGPLDPTPLAFSLTASLLTVGVFRFRLLQLQPVARARIIEVLDDPVLVLDPLDRVIDLTSSGERLLGRPAGEAVGMPATEVLPAAWAGQLRALGESPEARVQASVDGRDFELRALPVPDPRGEVIGRLVLARDVTAERSSQAAAHAAQARFEAAFQSALVGMAVVDAPSLRMTSVNRALTELVGREAGDLVGVPLPELARPEERATVAQALTGVLRGQGEAIQLETRVLGGADDVDRRVLLGAVRVSEGAGTYLLVQLEDVTERYLAEVRLRQLALQDPLTGLANRILLHDRLALALEGGQRRGRATGVLVLDLDRFKSVNDTYGHAAGDQLLRLVATRLTEVLRPQDTAARLGGDEFAVVLPDLEDGGAAQRVATRLLAVIARPYQLEQGEAHVDVSIGISTGRAGDDPEALLHDADAAMYLTKQRGRSGYTEFSLPLREELLRRVRTERELRAALGTQDLFLVYQPVVELPSSRPVGVEALLRWAHPQLGTLAPAAFLPVAEDAGLTAQIGPWVLRVAMADAVREPVMAGLTVAVNVSARQLATPEFPRDVVDALQTSGLEPSRLCLEITESTLLEALGPAADRLQQLRGLGVRVALDDFGTGYSSLHHVRELPVDIIKIDKSFVQSAPTQTADRSIVKLVVDLAHALGLACVAEGVETPDQLDVLTRIGCDQAQGFLFAVPQRAADLATRVVLPSSRAEPAP